MNAIFQIALSNAALVTVAAPGVWAFSRGLRKPAVSHALWLIVLLKLITPPLWTVPLPLPQWQLKAAEQGRSASGMIELSSLPRPQPRPESSEINSDVVPIESALRSPVPDPGNDRPRKVADSLLAYRSWHSLFISSAESLWLVGSILCLSIAIVRMIRFATMLRYATVATPPVQQRAAMLARRLQLGTAPAVWFIPGPLCPMLWTVGRSAKLLVPHGLWNQLDPAGRDTILLHELAHWRRRDDWVRWIELLATTLYWWHPVCWWARRELREAEEQCCDGWVLWALPGAFHDYANALLEAVEFISIRAERQSAPSAVPALASGMGQFGHLKRRLTMLKNPNLARGLSWGGSAAAFALAALLLPISPILGQENRKSEQKADTIKLDKAVQADRSVNLEVSLEDDTADDSTTRKLEAAKKEIVGLQRRLGDAESRLALLGKTDVGRPVNEKKATQDQTVVHSRDGRIVTTDPKTGDPKTGWETKRVPSEKPWISKEQIQEERLDADPVRGQADRLDRIEAQLRDLLREVQRIQAESTGSNNKQPRKH